MSGLKQKLRTGQRVYGFGAAMAMDRDEFRRIVERGEYDFAFIDSQHSAYSEHGLVEFCNLADELDFPVQLRIKHTRHAYLIGNLLDLGPSGIEVPQVERDESVAEALHSFYYPPLGGRSYGGPARRLAAQYADPFEYARWWNEYGVLWLQVESVAAVTGAYRLARQGVDCLSFGPVDLSFDLKCHPHPSLKTVDDCVAHVARQVQGTGVRVCFRNGTRETREKYAEMGVTVFLEQRPKV
jgi:2-keto-3-deoxy-L-rhamnonate aldolase RhmA